MTLSIPSWVSETVFYQIFPDRFAKSAQLNKPSNLESWGASPTIHGFQGGDLLGVVEKLDYLQDLGINGLYFNPIFASASNHRYHTHDYFQIDPLLGGNDAFDILLSEAHKRGIRVILDGVFNHSSRGFFQFNHILEVGSASPYVDWFHVHEFPTNAYDHRQPPGYAAWWGYHALPKFNTNTQAVREYLWRVGTYWLEKGIDGWRLDVPNEIDDDSFWQEFRRQCRAVNPDCYIVGELWGDAERWLQGDQFDAQMNYLFSRAAIGFVGRDFMLREHLAHTGLEHTTPIDGHTFAHELNRMFNELYKVEIVQAQMTMLDSHDTSRIATILDGNAKAVRLLMLALMTVPGAPNLYYGTEIGLEGRRDPDCRRAFPWQDETVWNKALRADIKAMIRLRHASPMLRTGNFSVSAATDTTVIYHREQDGQFAVVALNSGTQDEKITPWPAEKTGTLDERLTPAGSTLHPGETVMLPAGTGRIWITAQC